MRSQLQKLNVVWKGEGRKELGFGVGINHGEAIVGNIGSYEPHERLDPTVIGDCVNAQSPVTRCRQQVGDAPLDGARTSAHG